MLRSLLRVIAIDLELSIAADVRNRRPVLHVAHIGLDDLFGGFHVSRARSFALELPLVSIKLAARAPLQRVVANRGGSA